MGRELRRVPMDFDWPLRRTWHGYINPHEYETCRACGGSGSSSKASLFSDQWYGRPHNTGPDRGEAIEPFVPFDPVAYGAKPLAINDDHFVRITKAKVERDVPTALFYAERGGLEVELRRMFEFWSRCWSHQLIQADVDALVDHRRLSDFTRNARDPGQAFVVAVRMAFHDTNSWLPESNGYRPTADEVNRWSMWGMGHDSVNQWVCVRARCRREGFFYECAYCGGSGEGFSSETARALYESWESFGPPSGDGYQLWETTSEGSPISPVFATLDELCAYAASHCSTFADHKASAAEWRSMLDADFVHHREGNNIFI